MYLVELISFFFVAQQIDIWCNEDGLLTGNYVATELERIYDGDKIVKHDAATLIQPNGCE